MKYLIVLESLKSSQYIYSKAIYRYICSKIHCGHIRDLDKKHYQLIRKQF